MCAFQIFMNKLQNLTESILVYKILHVILNVTLLSLKFFASYLIFILIGL